MFVAVDIGNTNVKVGLWQERAWRLPRRARTVPDKTAHEYAPLLHDFPAVTGAAISSVVPTLTAALVELVRYRLQIEPLVVTAHLRMGIRIETDHPEQTGTDRIANVAAVTALFGGPAIAVDFGTATKFDVVTGDGDYKGGAIAPGIEVARAALVSRTMLLHDVNVEPPPALIGTCTTFALQSGIFWGYIALAEGMVARIKAAMNEEPIRVVATGGLAPLVSQHAPMIDVVAPNLTLDGLRVIYELNSSQVN